MTPAQLLTRQTDSAGVGYLRGAFDHELHVDDKLLPVPYGNELAQHASGPGLQSHRRDELLVQDLQVVVVDAVCPSVKQSVSQSVGEQAGSV